MVEGYRISSDQNEMNVKSIHDFLSQSYWARGIPIETLKKAIENSLCFGLFNNTDLQIGFARLITDTATYAYLADVYVLEEHRGKGLSKWMIQEIMDHPDLQGLRRIGLATRDAHELYKKYGFTELATPEIFMEKWNPNVYENTWLRL